MYDIAVIGAGAWGTALAQVYSQNGFKTLIWALEEDVVTSINHSHRNRYLPDANLHESLVATGSLADCARAPIILLTIPSKFLHDIVSRLKQCSIAPDQKLIICSKGIDTMSLQLPSEVVAGVFPNNPLFALAGPNLASEVANGTPSSASLAGSDSALGQQLAQDLSLPGFGLQYVNDVIGSQVFSAVKNVVAIAAGMLQGCAYGENTVSATVCRGLQEATKLAMAKGGAATTATELCAMGDMVLTCYSHKSRNTSLGIELSRGRPLDEIISAKQSVSEGVETSAAIHRLAKKLQVDMPVCQVVFEVLHCNTPLDEALSRLLGASVKLFGSK